MGPLQITTATGEAWKGGLQGRTSPYPLSRSVPPRGSGNQSFPKLCDIIVNGGDESLKNIGISIFLILKVKAVKLSIFHEKIEYNTLKIKAVY